jgi:hypothetical protein
MWFRRRPRQPSLDLASLERSLDRLMQLVEHILAVLPELVASRDANARAPAIEAAVPPASNPEPAPAPAPALNPAPEPEAEGFVLFVGGPSGYRLLERDGSPPSCHAELELQGARYVVLRLGPSPLPRDRRRCAFLEVQEPPRAERNPIPEEEVE